MGTTDEGNREELAAFLTVLQRRDSGGQPFVIVGGQAVNFWAEMFLAVEPRLSTHLPFTSKDLDLIGTKQDAERVALSAGWRLSPPAVGGGPVEAVLSLGSGDRALRVEFLREIKGVSAETIGEYARETSVRHPGTTEPIAARVLDPVLLLFGKLRNAVDIEQDLADRPRQDVKHVQMLSLCVPHFLNELLKQSVSESARWDDCRKYITMLAALRRTYSARQFETRHPGVIAWNELVPQSIRQVPWDPEARRSLRQLDETTSSRGMRI